MKPRINFAPVSGSPSTLVRLASGYLIFNGAFYLVLVTVAVLAFVIGWAGFGGGSLHWGGVLISIASGAGIIWTGVLIGRRKRLGGLVGLGLMLLKLVSALLSPRIDMMALSLSVIGVLVVISIWGELR